MMEQNYESSAPYQKGYLSYQRNISYGQNPYKRILEGTDEETFEWWAWNRGWKDACITAYDKLS